MDNLQTSFIDIQGLRVAYSDSLETIPNVQKDPAIVFLHGNSSSKASFAKQMDSELNQVFRLITLDFPGHGQSSRMEGSDHPYSISTFSQILRIFLERLNIENIVLVTHSLGGHIGNALLRRPGSLNIRGILTFQCTPVECLSDLSETFLPFELGHLLFSANPERSEVLNFFESMVKNPEVREQLIQDYLNTDPNFRLELQKSLEKEEWKELSLLRNAGSQIKFLHGTQDPLINFNYLKGCSEDLNGDNNPTCISGVGHFPQIEAPDDFNKALCEFLSNVNGLRS